MSPQNPPREAPKPPEPRLRPCDFCGTPTEDYWQGRVDPQTGCADSEVWCGCKAGQSRGQEG